MALIGLTGGIGAGKSAVADILRKYGYPVLIADELAKEITSPGSPALTEIQKNFGNDVLQDGALKRAKLREIITNNPSKREQLNQIMHPKIQQLCHERAQKLFSMGETIVFYEAPLLFEAKSDNKMDANICVTADDEIRIKRIVKRDASSEEAARLLLASQWPQNQKAQMSDYVIENNAGRSELEKSVMAILRQIESKFG